MSSRSLHLLRLWSRYSAPSAVWPLSSRPPPSAVLDQTDCTDTSVLHPDDTDGSYKLRIKELSKLWADARIQSALGSDYGPSDTILLDDSPYKAVANPEHTALHPKEWAGPTYPDGEVNNALGAGGAVRAKWGGRAEGGRSFGMRTPRRGRAACSPPSTCASRRRRRLA